MFLQKTFIYKYILLNSFHIFIDFTHPVLGEKTITKPKSIFVIHIKQKQTCNIIYTLTISNFGKANGQTFENILQGSLAIQ